MDGFKKQFAVCVDNTDYEASLTSRKIYEVVPDEEAAKDDFLPVTDESGEDYLFLKSHFVLIKLPLGVEQAIVRAKQKIAPRISAIIKR
jgi:hypothetical protein